MTLSSLLNLGTTGMRTHQFGVSNAGQNASNLATEGYSRRRAQLEPLGPGHRGSRAVGARRVVDVHVERRLLGARASAAQAETASGLARPVDELFADVDGSIRDQLDRFQQALVDLSTFPNDRAPRNALLQVAGDLAQSFSSSAESLAAVREEANQRIEDEVAQVNGRLEEIARLGEEIGRAENPFGQEASDLRDRRDQLVREVGAIVPVTALEQNDGTMSLLLGGSLSLVSPDGHFTPLEAARDAAGDMRVYRTTAGAQEDVTDRLDTGSIAGAIQARDGLVSETQEALDQLAFDVAEAYNAVHSSAFGLDGGTGRSLFTPHAQVEGAAAAMAVSGDVRGQPDLLAAADEATGLPGDNRAANRLLAVADGDVASGGSRRISEAYGDLVGAVGSRVRSIYLEEEYRGTIAEQAQAVRESVSGVSSDEEMVSLMQFQRAFEASLQVVRTADELLGEVIGLKR